MNLSGTILTGAGFTVTRTGVGQYTVTFAAGFTFTAPPIVVAMSYDDGATSTVFALSSATTAGGFAIAGRANTLVSGAVVQDGGFHFVALAHS